MYVNVHYDMHVKRVVNIKQKTKFQLPNKPKHVYKIKMKYTRSRLELWNGYNINETTVAKTENTNIETETEIAEKEN